MLRALTTVLAMLLACTRSPATLAEPGDVARGDNQIASRFATEVDSLRRSHRIPGLAVVVLRDTTIILARGFGLANVELAVAVTPETPFNIASVAKPISAVVALRLVERGLLDLDRPMKSFAGFTDFCAAARTNGGLFFGDYQCDTQPLTLRHVLSMTANGIPGTRFFYNPVSFSWASRPMAEAGKTPFSELTAKLVFQPAGMRRSARIHRQLALTPALAADLAVPYHVDSIGQIAISDPPPPQGDGAAGGVISTVMDLARFDVALSAGRLLSPDSRKVMLTANRSPTGTVLPYGLGWFVQDHAGEQLLWHSGLWEGKYSALYLKAPERRLTLILLANSDGLRWDNRLDEAAVERSPFAHAFLSRFPR